MTVRAIRYGFAGLTLIFFFSMVAASCNNSDKSENNSTTVDYNVPDTTTSGTVIDTSNISTTPLNASDTSRSTTGRTSTGGRKKGRVSVTTSPRNTNTSTVMQADKEGYYNYTETAPAFNGGQTALDAYINKNIEYPDDAIDNNMEGTVYVEFAIDENGKVVNAKTTGNKLGFGLEEAAIKAVNNMPGWTPGKVKGKNVKTWYTLPITFKLEE